MCYSPPLLAGFRCRWWCAVPRHSWLGSAGGGGAWCVVCGVWCVVCGGGVLVGLWLVCGAAGPSRVPGAVPRHSRLGSAGDGGVWWGCGWCVVWLVPRHSWRRFLFATPGHSWLGFAADGGVRLPATPGWGPPVVVVFFAGGGVLCCVCLWCVWVCAVAVLCCVLLVCGVCVVGGVVWWCSGCVFRVWWCAGGLRFGVPAPCLSWPLAVGVVPRHSWLGSAGCGGGGPGCPSPWSWCACVRCVALPVGVGGVGGGSCAVWLPCVCVCVLAVCGWWGVSYLGWFSSSVISMVQKAEEDVL